MANIDFGQIGAYSQKIAETATRMQEFLQERERLSAQRQVLEGMPIAPPVVRLSADDTLDELVETMKAQNEILTKQVDLLVEENERQRIQLDTSKTSEEQARKEAKSSRVFNWITFSISTAISLVALIISLVK